MSKARKSLAAKPFLAIDRRAQKLFKPYRKTPLVKALDTLGQAGDQLQLRLLCGGVIAAGLVRRDARLAGAGVRMLLSHEIANLAKKAVKREVDRVRPRSSAGTKAAKPHPGHSSAKEKQSFPSGHSAGAAAVSSAFTAVYPQFRAPAYSAAGAIAATRIVSCAHYPSDVAAGTAIGVVTDTVMGRAWRALRAVAQRRMGW